MYDIITTQLREEKKMKLHFEKMLSETNLSQQDIETIMELFIDNTMDRNKFISIDEDESELLFHVNPYAPETHDFNELTKSELTTLVTDFIMKNNSSTKQFVETIAYGFMMQKEFFEEPLRAETVFNHLYNYVSQDFTRLVYGSYCAMEAFDEMQGHFISPSEAFSLAMDNYVYKAEEFYARAFEEFGKEKVTDEMVIFIIVEDLAQQFNIEE